MQAPSLAPFRIAPFFSPRPWGTRDLSPWYDYRPAEPVGEAWLTGPQSLIETGDQQGRTLSELAAAYPDALLGPHRNEAGDYPLLVKILFPHDKLSVQVHPDDALAQKIGQPRGKTECWYVLDAQPGAAVALGLKPGATLEAMREAIVDHTLEDLVEQVPVVKGDMIFVDAGTVHAIGPGVTLLETQQTSDITYRLYDYGRPRELHIDRGLAATRLHTAAGKVTSMTEGARTRLIEQKYFTVDRLEVGPSAPFRSEQNSSQSPTSGVLSQVQIGVPHTLVAIEGAAVLHADGCEPVDLMAGRAVVVPAAIAGYRLESAAPASIIRSQPPASST
ncbi:MAG TPA: type I phosphomannose isomerase catalytic subunit [Acidobacteriaceae bacterium]